jgi:hypothetical protein
VCSHAVHISKGMLPQAGLTGSALAPAQHQADLPHGALHPAAFHAHRRRQQSRCMHKIHRQACCSTAGSPCVAGRHVHCQVCHSRGREATLLLCDGCRRAGCHLRCLQPALSKLTADNCFCPVCVPLGRPAEHTIRGPMAIGQRLVCHFFLSFFPGRHLAGRRSIPPYQR